MRLEDHLIVPHHLAIIMDGNGRWAKAKGKPRTDGHIAGVEALRRTLEAAGNMGVKVLTVYAFSTENWDRPKEEVDAIMELLVTAIIKEKPELMRQHIAIEAIGDISKLPENSRNHLIECIQETKNNSTMKLVLALSYSSRDEILRATKTLIKKAFKGELSIDDITEDDITNNLDTAHLPPLDLLIRTGGETRLSNFLMWQASYAELFFSETLWPDFGENDLINAFKSYSMRERRFGLISEQIKFED